MRRPLFDFVEQIRSADKYVDISHAEIRRVLMSQKGKCHLPIEFEVACDDGEIVGTELRLNINALSESALNWTMALKLHQVRIDGFDYETKFRTRTGGIGHGWHRHYWNAHDENADRDKLPLEFGEISSREQFLIRGLSLLKIRTNAVDHGRDLLDLLEA